MKRALFWIYERTTLVTLLALLISFCAGFMAYRVALNSQQDERLSLLKLTSERRGIELTSQTMNGNIMGGLASLGVMDLSLKAEVNGVVSKEMQLFFADYGRMINATGVLAVGMDGVVNISWDNTGNSSKGMNVSFRPYFRSAMLAKENVYAAVSMAKGERALYFAAPIYAEASRQASVIGVLAARTDLSAVDALLQSSSDIALLLSPQGVVFASNRPEWIGYIAEKVTPERVQAIRELKQFGPMFEKQMPNPLPFSFAQERIQFEGVTYLKGESDVKWNDPSGDWRLVLLENANRTISPAPLWKSAVAATAMTLLLLWLLGKLLATQLAQGATTAKLTELTQVQAEAVESKSELAKAGKKLQQAENLEQLGVTFLQACHHLVDTLQAVLYVANTDGKRLDLLSSYACASLPLAALEIEHSTLGAAYKNNQLQVLPVEQDDFWLIRSGLGGASPAVTVLLPIYLYGKPLGIAELAMLSSPDPLQRDQLTALAEMLALNLEIHYRVVKTEEALRFQQTLMDSIPYPIFHKDLAARFTGFNRAYETVFSTQARDLIGKTVMELSYLPLSDRIQYQQEDEQIIATSGSLQREMLIPFADGQLHRTLYFVSGFCDSQGNPQGLIGTFVDRGVCDATNLQPANQEGC